MPGIDILHKLPARLLPQLQLLVFNRLPRDLLHGQQHPYLPEVPLRLLHLRLHRQMPRLQLATPLQSPQQWDLQMRPPDRLLRQQDHRRRNLHAQLPHMRRSHEVSGLRPWQLPDAGRLLFLLMPREVVRVSPYADLQGLPV